METLIEIIGTMVLDLLQEIWPPILAIVNGALVLFLGFVSYLYYTADHPIKAVGSLVAAILFLVVFIAGFKTGVYRRRTAKKRQNGRRK